MPRIVGALKLPTHLADVVPVRVVFGGFVAFSTYLPKYLTTIYPEQVDQIGAGTRMGSFVIAAVIARPIGGVLADRLGRETDHRDLAGSIAVLAWVVSLQPPEGIVTGASFLAMAAALGVGMGAVFGWVPRLAPPDKVGSISGVVAAAGGLGGYFPPLVMGATYDQAHQLLRPGPLAAGGSPLSLALGLALALHAQAGAGPRYLSRRMRFFRGGRRRPAGRRCGRAAGRRPRSRPALRRGSRER